MLEDHIRTIPVAGALWIALVVAACGGDDGAASGSTTTTLATTTTAAASTTAAPATTTTTVPETTSPTTEPVATLTQDGNVYTVNWSGLQSTPFYAVPAASSSDPLYFIHTDPVVDGFYLAFEMYTTGYGQEWTGELGQVNISCLDPVASTGICPHFDPDGAGPLGDLNADFAATGDITIAQLDEVGYDITVNELAFSDGTSITGLRLIG